MPKPPLAQPNTKKARNPRIDLDPETPAASPAPPPSSLKLSLNWVLVGGREDERMNRQLGQLADGIKGTPKATPPKRTNSRGPRKDASPQAPIHIDIEDEEEIHDDRDAIRIPVTGLSVGGASIYEDCVTLILKQDRSALVFRVPMAHVQFSTTKDDLQELVIVTGTDCLLKYRSSARSIRSSFPHYNPRASGDVLPWLTFRIDAQVKPVDEVKRELQGFAGNKMSEPIVPFDAAAFEHYKSSVVPATGNRTSPRLNQKPRAPVINGQMEDNPIYLNYPNPQAIGGITIRQKDLLVLEKGEWLNDVIIDYSMKSEQFKYERNLAGNAAETKEDIHIFSSYFWKKYHEKGYEAVKSWTKKVNVFTQRALIFPVNDGAHWKLVVAVNPGDAFRPEAERKRQSFVLVLDSLGGSAAAGRPIVGWLQEEWRRHHPSDETDYKNNIRNMKCSAPTQDNGCDCGIYMIEYVHSFLEDVTIFDAAPGDARPPRLGEAKSWFKNTHVASRRHVYKQTLRRLQFWSQKYGLDDFGEAKCPEGVNPAEFMPEEPPAEPAKPLASSSSSSSRRSPSPGAKAAVAAVAAATASAPKRPSPPKVKKGGAVPAPAPAPSQRRTTYRTESLQPAHRYREGDGRASLAKLSDEERPQASLAAAAAAANLPAITIPSDPVPADQADTQPLPEDSPGSPYQPAEPTLPVFAPPSPELSAGVDELPLHRASPSDHRRPLVPAVVSESKRIKAGLAEQEVVNLDGSEVEQAAAPFTLSTELKSYSRRQSSQHRLFHDPEADFEPFRDLDQPIDVIVDQLKKEKNKKRGSTDEEWGGPSKRNKKEKGKGKKGHSSDLSFSSADFDLPTKKNQAKEKSKREDKVAKGKAKQGTKQGKGKTSGEAIEVAGAFKLSLEEEQDAFSTHKLRQKRK